MGKFQELRRKYPNFYYHNYQLEVFDNRLEVVFKFSVPSLVEFTPSFQIAITPQIAEKLRKDLDFYQEIENIVFHLGMLELVSYWKATACKKIIVEAGFLKETDLAFYREIFFQGLGEFFFVNQIEISKKELVDFTIKDFRTTKFLPHKLQDQIIIPVGGGKDSVVTLELFQKAKLKKYALIMNPRGASLKTAKLGGYSDQNKNLIIIQRNLDKRLIELNHQGYLNGHTPFSALLSFYTALAAVLYNCKYIALSNEQSASEGNIYFNNMQINHQYSKSLKAEILLNNFIKEKFNQELNYFSFLRPIYELKIAQLFASYPIYHQDFRSCNKGSKEDKWCGNCPKCLFVYIILSPFLEEKELLHIFGSNLLDKKELEEEFLKLIGIRELKPLECVGTRDEVLAALALKVRDSSRKDPYLLDLFKKYFSQRELQEFEDKALEILNFYGAENLIPQELVRYLKNSISNNG